MTRRHPFDPDIGGVRRSRARAVAARSAIGPDPAPRRGCALRLFAWLLALPMVPLVGWAASVLFGAVS